MHIRTYGIRTLVLTMCVNTVYEKYFLHYMENIFRNAYSMDLISIYSEIRYTQHISIRIHYLRKRLII